LDAAIDLTESVRQHLAVLVTDDAGNLVPVFLEQPQKTVEDPCPTQWRRFAPGGKRPRRCGDGFFHLGSAAKRYDRNLLSGRGIEDRLGPIGGTSHPLSVDVMRDLPGHSSFLF